MKKRKLIIVGVVMLLIGVVAILVVTQRPEVVITQTTGYLRFFDVTFESQEQIDTLIAGGYGMSERQGGTLLKRDFFGEKDMDAPSVFWVARSESEPLIRLDWASSSPYLVWDRQTADALAVEFREHLAANEILGVVSVLPIVVTLCRWTEDGEHAWGQLFFSDLLLVPTADLTALLPGKVGYRLLEQPQPLDCNAAAIGDHNYKETRTLDGPIPAPPPDHSSAFPIIGRFPEHIFR